MQQRRSTPPKVAVIGGGGTISLRARGPLDLWEYGDHGTLLGARDLVALLPPLGEAARIEVHEAPPILSTAADPSSWTALVAMIEDVCDDPELAGVVVTHGTATLDEAAYFLDLTLDVDVPVALVAAMRPTNVLGSDAVISLLDAVRVAGAPASVGAGVVVVTNGEIHCPRDLAKSSVHRLGALRSRTFGPLGHVEPDGSVAYYRRSTRARGSDADWALPPAGGFPRVDIVESYAGADGTAIDAFVAAGARAIVSAGLAPGRTTPAETVALERALQAGVAVIQSTRAGTGRVLQRAWSRERGIVVADDLLPQKARILAMLALTRDRTPEQLQAVFDRF